MACISVLLVAFLAVEPSPGVVIKPAAEATQVEVVATLSAELAATIPLGKLDAMEGERWLRLARIDEATGQTGEPMLGSYERRDETLVFRPRYALVPEYRYRATFSVAGQEPLVTEYLVPARPVMSPATVEAIYPTTDQVPANLLKFYLHFSRPMREGREIFERIKLLDDQGKAIESPWRNTELWDDNARRLTLWIHPGRVKVGVNLRDELGPVLAVGRRYALVIGADVRDAAGQPLAREFRKSFSVTADDHEQPMPALWTLRPPHVGTREPLVVEFPEPLDRHLLVRYLKVLDSRQTRIAGRPEVGPLETSWTFTPEESWRSEEYTLLADEHLEDLAGNTPAKPFEVDLDKAPPTPKALQRRFSPKSSSSDTPR
jgi:hypothetical protein